MEGSKATLLGKESARRMRLNPRNIFSEIEGQSQNSVPLPGHTARSHFPAIFAAQCSHGLSSSQQNLGVNDAILPGLVPNNLPRAILHAFSPSMVNGSQMLKTAES